MIIWESIIDFKNEDIKTRTINTNEKSILKREDNNREKLYQLYNCNNDNI